MKIFFLQWILILGFIIIHAQDQTTIDAVTEEQSSLTVELILTSTTSQTPTTTSTTTSTTVSTTTDGAIVDTNSTTTITTTTTTTTITTTTTTEYATRTPPPNPTWIIVGSIAGGIAAIGLLVTVTSIFICYSKSRKHLRIKNSPSKDPNSMRLRRIAH